MAIITIIINPATTFFVSNMLHDDDDVDDVDDVTFGVVDKKKK